MTDAIMPDLNQHVFAAAKGVAETKPKSEAEKREELIHIARNSHFWQRGLKPYIKSRIETLRGMLEVELTGNEPLEELGARFVIANAVAKELQDLINMVEVTADVIEERNDNKKKRTKT